MKKEAFEQRDTFAKKIKDMEAELDKLNERFAFGVFDDEALYKRLRDKKQEEIDKIREKLLDSESELSNLESYIQRSIDISQNIHSYWQLGSIEDKKNIQKLVFPEGVVINTKNRTYLTSKVNSLFLLKSRFLSSYEGVNKKLPTNNDGESCLVAGIGLEPMTFGL